MHSTNKIPDFGPHYTPGERGDGLIRVNFFQPEDAKGLPTKMRIGDRNSATDRMPVRSQIETAFLTAQEVHAVRKAFTQRVREIRVGSMARMDVRNLISETLNS
ncbi:MAG: hypothetical protein UT33_C0006G0089 [Candidatus Peregrinibacteria bacterium GW2011_GWC2_39_14]|nr:MAG: hypothetical protein UT33_C0006G0089 [Candidatus Peregrinibacteria bacterium GW2011_GWC2_39_14]